MHSSRCQSAVEVPISALQVVPHHHILVSPVPHTGPGPMEYVFFPQLLSMWNGGAKTLVSFVWLREAPNRYLRNTFREIGKGYERPLNKNIWMNNHAICQALKALHVLAISRKPCKTGMKVYQLWCTAWAYVYQDDDEKISNLLHTRTYI